MKPDTHRPPHVGALILAASLAVLALSACDRDPSDAPRPTTDNTDQREGAPRTPSSGTGSGTQ